MTGRDALLVISVLVAIVLLLGLVVLHNQEPLPILSLFPSK
jgi:hypothetical protein